MAEVHSQETNAPHTAFFLFSSADMSTRHSKEAAGAQSILWATVVGFPTSTTVNPTTVKSVPLHDRK